MRTLAAVLMCCLLPANALAESKRIEVYPLSQQYHDTREGETLSDIAASLLPNNPEMQQRLMRDIVQLNPQAFVDNNPNRLLAGKRLWLPSGLHQPGSKVDPRHYTVESFSWGNVKRPK